MGNKLLDFQAKISDVEQINPTFSTCKVVVMYTGKNRNMTIFEKSAIERALPSLRNIPIVGEFSNESDDYKGHGGKIDLDSYKFIHTTKPYGVVPESATYSWEEVKGNDGSIREYLVIEGCYLWTGRYEEAKNVVENGKGQSMEIEVLDGSWDENEEAYRVNNFTFSALCILGDNVEPAFEDAKITSYSFDKNEFKSEFTEMLKELKFSLSDDYKEGNEEMLKKLLEKYSLTVEELTEKGIDFNAISEDELEDKILEVFELEKIEDEEDVDKDNEENTEDNNEDDEDDVVDVKDSEEYKLLQEEVVKLEASVSEKDEELEELRNFKLNVEKENHEVEVLAMFEKFQLTEEDVSELDIHKFSVEDIEEKCFAILGRKMAIKKNYTRDNGNGGIKLPLGGGSTPSKKNSRYGDLLD